MFNAIVRKEFVEAWRDQRFVFICAVLAALLLLVVATGLQRYLANAADRASAEAATYAQWKDQGVKNPHAAAHFGLYAFKTETPFAYAERGINDFAGGSIWLEAHRQNLAQNRAAQDGVSVERIGSLSAGFLLQIILPLVIILLGHRTFAGEREAGILSQTLSLGVSPVRLFVGKSLGAGAALLVLAGPLVILGACALAFASGPDRFAWSRAGLFTLLYAAYVLLWLMLTVGVSAACRTARTALVTLVAVWMATSFVVPRLAAEAARSAYPTPTYAAFMAKLDSDTKNGLDGRETVQQYRARLTAETLARYGVTDPKDLPINLVGLVFTWLENWGDRVFDYNFGQLYSLYARQEKIIETASFLSPALAAHQLTMAISGSDLATHEAFVKAAEDHRRSYINTMNIDMTNAPRPSQGGYAAGPALWASVEAFTFSPPDPLGGLGRDRLSVFALLAWLGAAAALGALAVRRIQPGTL